MCGGLKTLALGMICQAIRRKRFRGLQQACQQLRYKAWIHNWISTITLQRTLMISLRCLSSKKNDQPRFSFKFWPRNIKVQTTFNKRWPPIDFKFLSNRRWIAGIRLASLITKIIPMTMKTKIHRTRLNRKIGAVNTVCYHLTSNQWCTLPTDTMPSMS